METTIVPGLVVKGSMFEAAVDGLATHAPDLEPFTWERFTDRSGWTLVPNADGIAYKAELVVLASVDRTVKINLWSLPDRRGGERPQPHNHPWSFQSVVLLGGYTEDRYVVPTEGGTPRAHRGVERCGPAVNEIAQTDYHEVTEIHHPQATLTLMICGPRTQGGIWGYLDTDTGDHASAAPDPDFSAKLKSLNPHHR